VKNDLRTMFFNAKLGYSPRLFTAMTAPSSKAAMLAKACYGRLTSTEGRTHK